MCIVPRLRRVVAPILRRARPAGLPGKPCALRIRPAARMKADAARNPQGIRLLSLSFRPQAGCGSCHALRSGPHRGAGIMFPLVWPAASERAAGLSHEVRAGILTRIRVRGGSIRDEKPAGPVPRQGRTILCVWPAAPERAAGLSPEGSHPCSNRF